jgi:hypothetical protein
VTGFRRHTEAEPSGPYQEAFTPPPVVWDSDIEYETSVALEKYERAKSLAIPKDGAPKDEEQAAKLLKESARLGFAPALYNLGLLHVSGGLQTIDVNPGKAGYYLLLAADEGHKESMRVFDEMLPMHKEIGRALYNHHWETLKERDI